MTEETPSFSYWTGAKMIIRLTTAQEKYRDVGENTSNHIHPAHELLLVKQGKLTVGIKDRQFELTAGMLMAVPQTTRHFVSFTECGCRFINILFRGTLFPFLAEKVIDLQEGDLHIAQEIVRNMMVPFDYIRGELASAQLSVLLCTLAKRFENTDPYREDSSSNVRTYVSGQVLDILNYLEENHAKNLTLEMAAKHARISASYLRHLLLKETGAGFSAHLLQIRVNHAKKMIEKSPEHIKTIALECGFNSMAFFYKTFKRLTGFTPMEYGKSRH